MKNLIFNSVLFIGIALLSSACSKDDKEEVEPVKTISTLTFVNGSTTNTTTSKGLRTTLSGWDVNWSEGDQIGVISLSDPTSNSCFELISAAGSNSGTFRAKTAADNLMAGGTYVAYYPYRSGRYSSSELYSMNGAYPADKDLMLSSSSFTLGLDGNVNNTVYMNHEFTLVQVQLKVTNSSAKAVTLSAIALQTSDGAGNATPFASSVSVNSSGNAVYVYGRQSINLQPATTTVLNSNFKTFYFLVRQDPTQVISPIQFKVDASLGGAAYQSVYANVPTNHAFAAGASQIIYLDLTINTDGTEWNIGYGFNGGDFTYNK